MRAIVLIDVNRSVGLDRNKLRVKNPVLATQLGDMRPRRYGLLLAPASADWLRDVEV